MAGLEAALERARALDTEALADSIQAIGFECTRCGKCCSGTESDPHTATIFPDEVRSIASETDDEWEDVARPIPFGLTDGTGETFEWALQTDECGDCRFLIEEGETTSCGVYRDRPLICRTYPFSVDVEAVAPDAAEKEGGENGNDTGRTDGSGAKRDETEPPETAALHNEAVVETHGNIRAHECPGLGTAIGRDRAVELAATLKERTIREFEEAIAVREAYDPDVGQDEPVVVHDSEGAKRPDGSEIPEIPRERE